MLQKEDRLKIECTHTLSHAHFQALRMLYYPLIGNEALSLYETLYALSKQPQRIKNHLLICKLCMLKAELLEQKRMILEQYLLLKTYYDGAKNTYLYELMTPKIGCEFLSHEVFGRLYMEKLGKQVFEFMKKSFAPAIEAKTDYQNISTHMSDMLQNWNEEQEALFILNKPSVPKKNFHFRFERFLNNLSPMILPLSERTKDNLDFIAEKADLYGIDEIAMQKLVGKSINLKTNRLDRKKLVEWMQKSQDKKAVQVTDPYDMPSALFLQQKQNGIALSKSDQELIELLNEKYQLNPQVINVLLDYVLERNNQSLARKYVEKIAAAWVRLGIDTKEKALAESQKENTQTYPNKKTKQLPKWFYEQDKSEQKNQEEAVNDEELMEQLRKLREQHG